MEKILTGTADYDYKYDILFFKAKGREYVRSIELMNVVLDVDSEGVIVGIQIFDASSFLNVSKNRLMDIPKWRFQVTVATGKVEVRLAFQVKVRNRIVEKNPIITEPTSEPLQDQKMVCVG